MCIRDRLLIYALDHVGLVDTLILAADEVAVEVKVHIVDSLDLGQDVYKRQTIHSPN